MFILDLYGLLAIISLWNGSELWNVKIFPHFERGKSRIRISCKLFSIIRVKKRSHLWSILTHSSGSYFPLILQKTNKQTNRDAHEPEDEVGKPQSSVPGLTTSHAPFPGTKPLLRTQLVLCSGGAAASPLPQGVEPGPPGLSRREALVTGLFSVPEPQGEKRNQQSELPRFLSFGSKIITKYTIKNLNGFSWYFLSRESM